VAAPRLEGRLGARSPARRPAVGAGVGRHQREHAVRQPDPGDRDLGDAQLGGSRSAEGQRIEHAARPPRIAASELMDALGDQEIAHRIERGLGVGDDRRERGRLRGPGGG
jgi:hypothetical protein